MGGFGTTSQATTSVPAFSTGFGSLAPAPTPSPAAAAAAAPTFAGAAPPVGGFGAPGGMLGGFASQTPATAAAAPISSGPAVPPPPAAPATVLVGEEPFGPAQPVVKRPAKINLGPEASPVGPSALHGDRDLLHADRGWRTAGFRVRELGASPGQAHAGRMQGGFNLVDRMRGHPMDLSKVSARPGAPSHVGSDANSPLARTLTPSLGYSGSLGRVGSQLGPGTTPYRLAPSAPSREIALAGTPGPSPGGGAGRAGPSPGMLTPRSDPRRLVVDRKWLVVEDEGVDDVPALEASPHASGQPHGHAHGNGVTSPDKPSPAVPLLEAPAESPRGGGKMLSKFDAANSPAGGNALPRWSAARGWTSAESASDPENVQEFTVGVKGLGKVVWPGATDVRGLDLDKLVQFEFGSVTVYPDEDSEGKPPLGEGLNKRAVVSLEGIGLTAKDKKRYAELLREKTEEFGGTFVGYEPDTGTWSFEVPHF